MSEILSFLRIKIKKIKQRQEKDKMKAKIIDFLSTYANIYTFVLKCN